MMRNKLVLAVLVSCAQYCSAAVDKAWLSALNAAVKGQVQSQVEASIAQAVPGIASASAAAVINQQLATFTAATQQAVAAPVAPQVTPAVIVAQPATQAAVAAVQPLATQVVQQQAAAAPVATTAAAQDGAVVGVTKTTQVVAANNAAEGSTSAVVNPIATGASSVIATLASGGLTTITTDADSISLSTLSNGTVVTVASVSTIYSPTSQISGSKDGLLTDAQGSIINGTKPTSASSGPTHSKTALVGDSNLSGNVNVHTTTGLSKAAAIGMGVGIGSLALVLCGGFFAFRWWARRKQEKKRHNRTPSIVISDPLGVDQASGTTGSLDKSAVDGSSELTGHGTVEMEHSPTTAATLKSSRSPVSAWIPGSTMSAESHTLAPQPSIFELMGSDAIEMPGPTAASEVAGCNAAKEVPGSLSTETKSGDGEKERPFSFVQTPLEAFIPGESHTTKPDTADLASVAPASSSHGGTT